MTDLKRVPVFLVQCQTGFCEGMNHKRTVYAEVERGLVYVPRYLCRYCLTEPKILEKYQTVVPKPRVRA